MQDDAWRVEVGISYLNGTSSTPDSCLCVGLTILDPQSNSDFEAIKAPIPDVDPGHMCYPIPNPPADIREGGNGTIQIRYTADFSTDLNETYYACADIHYVLIENFDTQVPCFNVSSDDFSLADEDNEGDDNDEDDSASPAASSAPQSTSGSSESNSPSSGSGSSLSGGAIAGIVIGVVAVLATIGGFFFIWGRRKQQQKHRQQEANVRAVKWTEDSRSSASGSKQEDGDIPLRDM